MAVETPMRTALSIDEQLEMYRKMRLIRLLDETGKKLIERGEIFGEIHQYVGEEAVAVGVCSALRSDDVITSTHRGHGHILAKGGDLKRVMAELGGKETGYCKGKGGSMHIADAEIGIFGANGIVGAGTPIATGAAFAAKYRGNDHVAVTFFGDGASNQGVVHESMNLAAIYQLPVIFVCENNRYQVSFPVEQSTSVRRISDRAAGYSMPGISVDGMDVLAVREAAEAAVARARAGQGPSLIEARTYRFYGHFTAESSLLRKPYRSDEEIAEARRHDPVEGFRKRLLEMGSTEERLASVDAAATTQLEEAIAFMRESPLPAPEEAYADVYADYEPTLPVRGW